MRRPNFGVEPFNASIMLAGHFVDCPQDNRPYLGRFHLNNRALNAKPSVKRFIPPLAPLVGCTDQLRHIFNLVQTIGIGEPDTIERHRLILRSPIIATERQTRKRGWGAAAIQEICAAFSVSAQGPADVLVISRSALASPAARAISWAA